MKSLMQAQIIKEPVKIPEKIDRLNTLYQIINKEGASIPFRLNWAQRQLFHNRWPRDLVLKCRQIGSTTFWALYFLDDAIFNSNKAYGIITHSMSASQDIFRRIIKHAIDKLDPRILSWNPVVNDSAHEVRFANGSYIRVDTTMRSGTLTGGLLVSEFGKICAKHPDKAREIIAGSLNAVPDSAIVVIESTSEGREGPFYTMWEQYQNKQPASNLDFKTFFFPWWLEPTYRDEVPIEIEKGMSEYFKRLESKEGIKLKPQQKYWYIRKEMQQPDSMRQEYPSTAEEAWEGSHEGFYYASILAKLRLQGRITDVPYDDSKLVHTSWDLGVDDHTVIWFFQLGEGGAIKVIDYYEGYNEGGKHYADYCRSTGYTFGTHIMPHDSRKRDTFSALSYVDQMREIMPGTIYELQIDSVLAGIQAVRSGLGKCYFDLKKCSEGLKHLDHYKKEWDDRLGCYRATPLHNDASHASDSFRYLINGLQFIDDDTSEVNKAWIKDMKRKYGSYK